MEVWPLLFQIKVMEFGLTLLSGLQTHDPNVSSKGGDPGQSPLYGVGTMLPLPPPFPVDFSPFCLSFRSSLETLSPPLSADEIVRSKAKKKIMLFMFVEVVLEGQRVSNDFCGNYENPCE